MDSSPSDTGHGGIERRDFLKIITGSLAALPALVLAAPFLSSLIEPAYRKTLTVLTRVGGVESLPVGSPLSLSFTLEKMDAYIGERVAHAVWVIKHTASDLTVFSPICPHLGCHYGWEASAHEFVCPCHGSIFSLTGKVLGGPAPRPLDTLPHKIRNGGLFVEWERFEVGIPEKIRE